MTTSNHVMHKLYNDAVQREEALASWRVERGLTLNRRGMCLEATRHWTRAPWYEVAEGWAAGIAEESLRDVIVKAEDVRHLLMDPTDGALAWDESKGFGKGAPMTRHAAQQLFALLGATRAGEFLKYEPRVFAGALNEQAHKAKRNALVLRMTADPLVTRDLQRGDGARRVHTVRGCVSLIHAREYFDDRAVMRAIQGMVDRLGLDTSTARVTRSTSETWGNLELGGRTSLGDDPSHIWRGFSWRNSEVKACSLAFHGSITIACLNEAVLQGRQVVVVGAEDDSASIRHVLPGGTPEKRHRIAQERMAAAMSEASEASVNLGLKWEQALRTSLAPAALVDEVFIDAVEETLGFKTAAIRERFGELLKNEKVLAKVPRCTYAHVAAVYALMGERQTAGEIILNLPNE